MKNLENRENNSWKKDRLKQLKDLKKNKKESYKDNNKPKRKISKDRGLLSNKSRPKRKDSNK